jgi:hypothetical protein
VEQQANVIYNILAALHFFPKQMSQQAVSAAIKENSALN